MSSFLAAHSHYVYTHLPRTLSPGMCCWTRLCAEVTLQHLVVRTATHVVRTAEIPYTEHGGGVSCQAARQMGLMHSDLLGQKL